MTAGGCPIRPTSKGFSLIEVMIVIAVIGVLMAVAAPNFARSMRQGKERTLRSDLQLVRSALASFYADTGCFPVDLTDLSSPVAPANCVNSSSVSQALSASSFKGPYVPYVPADSVSGSGLSYNKVSGSVPSVRSSATGTDSAGVAFANY